MHPPIACAAPEKREKVGLAPLLVFSEPETSQGDAQVSTGDRLIRIDMTNQTATVEPYPEA